MKYRIYLSLGLLIIFTVTACGDNREPTAIVTPEPPTTSAVTPTPVTTIQPTPTPPPLVSSAPVIVKIPNLQPTPKPLPTTPIISALPKSFYPNPAPVAIPNPVAKPNNTVAAKPQAEPISKLKIPTDPTQQITPVGIGNAKIGMTFQELKEQMGKEFQFPIKTSFIEGFDAIAVTKAGAVQYYIPYPSGTQFTDSDRIQHLMTDNPSYRTEKGVGPGTSIKQATTVYGGATLSMSKENESREFISFTQHPSGLAFRPKPVGKNSFAGEYPESNEEYLKTQKYDNRAAIGQITVSCPEDQCDHEH